MKGLAAALLALLMLCSCAGQTQAQEEVIVFAAASLTEAMDTLAAAYEQAHPGVDIIPTYDSSGTLLSQLQAGAQCHLFLSAAQKQMTALEQAGMLVEGSPIDLLENQVVLVSPKNSPKDIRSFDHLAQLLAQEQVFLAMGNSDVPVGAYTREILNWYGLDEAALAAAGCITYGSNVKEVVTQVCEGAVDCGVVYATDAATAGLPIMDAATGQMCSQVIYPAALLTDTAAAQDFFAYLQGQEAADLFADVGFTPLCKGSE